MKNKGAGGEGRVCGEVEVGGVRGEKFFCEWSSTSFLALARARAGNSAG